MSLFDQAHTIAARRARLRAWIDEHFGGVQQDFVAAVGINQGELSGLLRDKSFGEKKARKLELAARMPAGYLVTPTTTPLDMSGLDAIIAAAYQSPAVASPRDSAAEIPPGYVRLPQYGEVSAGGGAVVDESDLDVVRYLDVAERWAKQHLPRDLSRIRVLGVRGDSMAPDIQHDDVLFVDTGTRHFDAPGLYVLNWQGRALVKRLVPEMRSGRLAIVSTNPAYPPEYVEPGEIDQLHIGGRVSAWWTLRKF